MRYILVIIYLTLSFPAFSQTQYDFQQITTDGGLSNNTVLGITQDGYGRIWFATYDGLTVYDGNSYKALRYDPAKEETGLPQGQAYQIVVDENFVWVLFENNKLIRLLDDNGNCIHYDLPVKQKSKYRLVATKRGDVTLKRDSDYFICKPTENKLIQITDRGYLDEIKTQEKVLLQINSKFLQFKPDALVFDIYENLRSGEFVISTTNTGAWIYVDNRFRNLTEISSFKSFPNEFYTSFIDREGNLWLGTKDSGVLLGRKSDILLPQGCMTNLKTTETIRAVLKEDNGRILLGTYNSGIVLYDGLKNMHYKFKDQFGDKWDWIRSLYKDSQNNIWIGSYGGLLKCSGDLNNKEVFLPGNKTKSIHKNRIYSITEDKNGIIYLGAWGGLEIYNPVKNEFTVQDSILGLPSLNIRKLFFDTKGKLWIGTESSGVYKVDTEKACVLTHYTEFGEEEMRISGNSIFDICEDKNGKIYLGTFGGINAIDRSGVVDKFTDINEKLPTTLVYKMFIDSINNLWFSTSKCIAKFNSDKRTVRIYDTKDGFPISDYTEGAGFKGESGELYFGGNSGVIGFEPAKVGENKVLPKPFIKNVKIDHNDVVSLRKDSVYEFSYFTKSIDIELGAIILNQPEKTVVKWRLSPYDKEWHSACGSYVNANYTHLAQGKYSLEVKTLNADLICTEPTQLFSFDIAKPLWQKSGVIFSLVIVIILISVIITKIRFQNIKKRNLHLESLIAQRTEKINNQKNDLEKFNNELALKNEKMKAQRDKILSQNDHLLEMHKQLEELNLLKQKFFTNISHDIKTPLTLISGPLSELMKDNQLDEKYKEKLERMRYNVNYIVQLLDQVLDKKSLELGGIQKIVTQGDLVQICRSVINSFQDQANLNNQKLQFTSTHKSFYIRFDYDKLQQVIFNLMANALKFTNKNGSISCDLSIREHIFTIIIKDTGVGMPSDRLEYIFDRYYQIDKNPESSKGSGIGLSMVKDFVNLLDGVIHVESEPGTGSSFTVQFPITTIVHTDFDNPISNTDRLENVIADVNREKILVVEDNLQLREYLTELLEEKYSVVSVKNGEEAISILRKNKTFNLILSDWMMDELDGIGLCKYVKKKVSLNHIPFLLLTALSQLKNQKEGYMAGVDEYITKPFEPEILFLKIETLLNRQKTIVQTVKANSLIKPELKEEKTYDEKLVAKINEVLNKGISSSDFNQHILATELGVSQMQLYRKVKENLHTTPNELIRTIRIKKAKGLLEKDGHTINEVSFLCGFNDPKYFSRCFTKETGVSPSEFKKGLLKLVGC